MSDTPADPLAQKSEPQYIRTRFVFVDTEAYRRQSFDWEGEALSGLLKLAKAQELVLLTTHITKREVQRHLDLWVDEAVAAVHKHRRLLKLGGLDAGQVSDGVLLKARAQAAFHDFLHEARAIEVPITFDAQSLVDDHFENRPPFSSKKSSEFKDAMVCASLAAWCAKYGHAAYVVSNDPDLRAYCMTTQQLFHVDRVADVLSRALSSDTLHRELREAFSNNDGVAQALVKLVVGVRARTPGASRHFTPGPINAKGRVTSARLDEIADVSALEISGDEFVCEVNFYASVMMELDVEDARHYDEGSEFFQLRMEKSEPFSAVVTVRYDGHKRKVIEVLNVDADIDPIELSEDDVKDSIY